jgi:hypothetical protein
MGIISILDSLKYFCFNGYYSGLNSPNRFGMQIKVGEIEGYDVIYVPEKDQVFCKNTMVSFPVIEAIIRSNLIREEISEKNLVITKNLGIVTLGCLTTTMNNCLKIRHSVNSYKNKNR